MQPVAAQQPTLNDLKRCDSLFWVAYNRCDVAGMTAFLPDNFEFYHDVGGPLIGKPNFEVSLSKNLCGNPDFRLRREVIDSTVQIFPLKNQGVLYGALFNAEHLFYINETGKQEFLDGHASFSHLWMIQQGEWKLTRSVSYNHHPANK